MPDGPPPGPQVDERPARTAAPADRWALLVGVTDYPRRTADTVAGAADVRRIRDALLAAGWPADNVRVLTDGAATGSAVRDGLAWLAARTQPGTFAFFHYSGHVRQLGGSHRGAVAGRPVVRARRRGDRGAGAGPGTGVGRHRRVRGRPFLPGLPSDRVLVSASSTGSEKSYEQPAWGRSVWTGLVFELGTRQGQADADRDGRVTIGEALRYATYYAQKVTRDQRPYGRQTPQVEGDPVRGWTLDAPPA